jgi:hypothetical protein
MLPMPPTRIWPQPPPTLLSSVDNHPLTIAVPSAPGLVKGRVMVRVWEAVSERAQAVQAHVRVDARVAAPVRVTLPVLKTVPRDAQGVTDESTKASQRSSVRDQHLYNC